MTLQIQLVLLAWLALLAWFVYSRMQTMLSNRAKLCSYRPQQSGSPDILFYSLLSANLALLEFDNFNQIASGKPYRKAKQLLCSYWGIRTRDDLAQSMKRRLAAVGLASPAESLAFDAWLQARLNDNRAFGALAAICHFLASEVFAGSRQKINTIHLNVTAHDVQQLAYMVRLALRVGWIELEEAERVLTRLSRTASRHYDSWSDFSLSALICMGMRNDMDIEDPVDWDHIVHTHRVLLTNPETLIDLAAGWSKPESEIDPTAERPSSARARWNLTSTAFVP